MMRLGRLRALLAWLVMMVASFALLVEPGLAAKEDTPFAARARALPTFLDGGVKASELFSPAFLAQIPPEQLTLLARQLTTQNGRVRGLARAIADSPTSGVVELDYERSIVRMQMAVASTAPHQIIGLLVTSVRPKNDSVQALSSDVAALPGKASLVVQRLGKNTDPPIVDVRANDPMAIGSIFKLWLLGELASQVKAGRLAWNAVAQLERKSLPSGMMQDWPDRAPATIHTLATLMISVSDNSASDTLLYILGRESVDAAVVRMGHANAGLTLPVLSTREAFALKMVSNADLRRKWEAGDVVARRKMLLRNEDRLSLQAIRGEELGQGPRYIDTVEWFASATDMSNMLNSLRSDAGIETLKIMAVNSPLPLEERNRFLYSGFKGGSEPGVVAMAHLLQSRDGAWYAVAGAWNNKDAPVDEQRFSALVARAIGLIQ